MKADFLIIGSGVAGLSLAIKLAENFPEKNVLVITKSQPETSNTQFAQGGIAVVTDFEGDSFEQHIQDTLICGGGLCDEDVVKMVVEKGPDRLKDLIAWGANFDMNSKGLFDLGKEGGHATHRVVHHKDQTGREMILSMLRYIKDVPNIALVSHLFAVDLLVEDGTCFGVKVFNEHTNELQVIYSNNVLLSTGGIGQVYGHTTNSEIATGDGIAMAFRAGAAIQDMEFVQFHPTALYSENASYTFLISEAVRGFGAYLRTKSGERFMYQYDERLELAPRDIVSQSIDLELKKTGDKCVYLDCSHLDMEQFKKHFPMIYEQCQLLGIDLSKEGIPVAPAQHYLCGGVVVDKNGKTTIQNLYASGETARTGLHGANRLASNSLLEAVVYSDCIFNYLKNNAVFSEVPHQNSVEQKKNEETFDELLNEKRKMLQALMRKNVGIVRNVRDLEKTLTTLEILEKELKKLSLRYSVAYFELINMIAVGKMIIQSSLNRKESIGTFVIQ